MSMRKYLVVVLLATSLSTPAFAHHEHGHHHHGHYGEWHHHEGFGGDINGPEHHRHYHGDVWCYNPLGIQFLCPHEDD